MLLFKSILLKTAGILSILACRATRLNPSLSDSKGVSSLTLNYLSNPGGADTTPARYPVICLILRLRRLVLFAPRRCHSLFDWTICYFSNSTSDLLFFLLSVLVSILPLPVWLYGTVSVRGRLGFILFLFSVRVWFSSPHIAHQIFCHRLRLDSWPVLCASSIPSQSLYLKPLSSRHTHTTFCAASPRRTEFSFSFAGCVVHIVLNRYWPVQACSFAPSLVLYTRPTNLLLIEDRKSVV